MSRSVFLSVVGIITILSCVDNVDAQRFRNRNNNNCGCQPNSQQSYQPYRANYQQQYQANYRPYGVRRNYVAPQRAPIYYQQNALLRYQPVQQVPMRQQAQARPMVQYSVAQGCWVPVQNPYGQTQMQYGRLPMTSLPVDQANSAASINQVTPMDPKVAAEPSEVQPATFESPLETSGLPLSAPESIQTVDPIPAAEPAASSVLDKGN